MRPYQATDVSYLIEMLRDESIPYAWMQFDNPKFQTTVMADAFNHPLGFFTLGEHEPGIALLKHFCIAREARSPETARELAGEMKKEVKRMGYKRFITGFFKARFDIARFIIHYFRNVARYSEQGDCIYILVEVK